MMEGIMKSRIALRNSFTKTANKLEEHLKLKVGDDELCVLHSQLNDKWYKLEQCDNQIIESLKNDVKCSETEFTEEYELIEEYSDRYICLKTKTELLLQNTDPESNKTIIYGEKDTLKRKYKLPKIELKKFSGEILEWLGFWGQFKKIDEDSELDPEDKFNYLVQSTVEGSKARDIVQSFPPTADNYKLAVEHLKSRFGKDDVLVEVYVRELLRLVLNNAVTPEKRTNLLKLYDRIETHLRALESLGMTSDKYAAMLYPLVEACLPEEVLRTWERNFNILATKAESETSKLELLMKFLRSEVEGEERISLVKRGFGFEKQKKDSPQNQLVKKDIPTASGLLNGYQKRDNFRNKVCTFCENNHNLEDCKSFQNISLEDKRNFVLKSGCCFVCLRKGHTSKFCKNSLRCSKCSKRHRAVMCPETEISDQRTNVKPDHKKVTDDNDHILSNRSSMQEVVMQTLNVRVRGPRGEHVIRALIDSGSQRSYLKKETALDIGYKSLGEEKINHCLFGGIETLETHQRYRLFLTSMRGDYKCNFEVYDQEKICSDVPKIRNGPWIEELKDRGIFLSDFPNEETDERFYDEEIQLLIGADVAGKLLTSEILQLSNGLTALGTQLGWVLMGKMPREAKCLERLSVFTLFSKEVKMKDLWSFDILGITDPAEKLSKVELEEATKTHFRENLKREEDGRYEVCLPWLQDHIPLQTNKMAALRRLKTTVKILQEKRCISAYEEVFKDWLKEEIIQPVDLSSENNQNCHYLPHRAVFKMNSTTKIRPVFDASAKTKDGISLNDCLQKGPNLIDLIPSILNRFRMGKYGVTADIRKAFLQISMNEKDRNFLRFLWWEEGNPEKLKVFRHRRVVFDVNCSPFLLAATLQHHLENSPEHLKNVAIKLRESFYVDNCVTSFDSANELNDFIEKSKELMFAGKFDLRGWVFNKPLLEDTNENVLKPTSSVLDIKNSDLQKEEIFVLGLKWNVKNDELSCDWENIDDSLKSPVTKRLILSIANTIFDPVGFLSPVTLVPKVLLQECWCAKLSGNTEVTDSLAEKFQKWRKLLCTLKHVSISRRMLLECESSSEKSFHVFCDASKIAYATCVYIRVKNRDDVSCQFVQTRSRVVPIKDASTPRLELLTCCIGARLVSSIKQDLRLEHIATYYWSDSMNAIYWIRNQEPWATFVMNRVKEIKSLSNSNKWRHVPGHLNPGDLPSRGCAPEILFKKRWWEGPHWLMDVEKKWLKNEIAPCPEVVNSEKKKTVVTSTQVHLKSQDEDYNWYYKYFSSYNKIVRMLAWISRFNEKVRGIKTANSANLTVPEIEEAEKALFPLIQKESFKGVNDENIRNLRRKTVC